VIERENVCVRLSSAFLPASLCADDPSVFGIATTTTTDDKLDKERETESVCVCVCVCVFECV
jgi:hypothetical protein